MQSLRRPTGKSNGASGSVGAILGKRRGDRPPECSAPEDRRAHPRSDLCAPLSPNATSRGAGEFTRLLQMTLVGARYRS